MSVKVPRSGTRSVSVPIEQLPEVARVAWTRMRDELYAILGEDLVAIWAYGGTIGPDRPQRPADLDTHVIVRRRPDEQAARRIDQVLDSLADKHSVEFDTWFIADEDARRPEPPPHAFREGRRDTAWALHRAHWLAGRYVRLHGPEPAAVIPAPTWAELEIDLDRELEHIERHVLEGDNDAYEAAYAVLNGSRILHSVETRDVVLSKRAAGTWALDHIPERWHRAIQAAMRAYDGQASSGEARWLASEMAPFVALVRERFPVRTDRTDEARPRWSGH